MTFLTENDLKKWSKMTIFGDFVNSRGVLLVFLSKNGDFTFLLKKLAGFIGVLSKIKKNEVFDRFCHFSERKTRGESGKRHF